MKRSRSFSDSNDETGSSPPAKKQATKNMSNTCPQIPNKQPIINRKRDSRRCCSSSSAPNLSRNSPGIVGDSLDSGVDLTFPEKVTESPNLEEYFKRELSSPDTRRNKDWGPIFDTLEARKVHKREEMETDKRRRLLTSSVTDPAAIQEAVELRRTIRRSTYFPPAQGLQLSPDDLQALEKQYSLDVHVHLESIASELAPDPKSLEALGLALAEFDGSADVMEPKFAGSKFASLLLRQATTCAPSDATELRAILDFQPSLYRGTKEYNTAFIFQSIETRSFLSVARKPDFAYCLDIKACDPYTQTKLEAGPHRNHFPCLSSSSKALLPIATGEVKVTGHPYTQRYQQGTYAVFYIISWLVLRILEKKGNGNTLSAAAAGAESSSTELTEDLLKGVHHCCFGISPFQLQIWEYRPYKMPGEGVDQLRISAQLLCSGSPGDLVFMEDVYIPWCRYVLKRGFVEQQLRLVPAIRAYAARSYPRPFDFASPVMLKMADLRPSGYNLSSSTFSNDPAGADQERFYDSYVKPYEEAVKLVNAGRKRKSSSASSSFRTGLEDERTTDSLDSLR